MPGAPVRYLESLRFRTYRDPNGLHLNQLRDHYRCRSELTSREQPGHLVSHLISCLWIGLAHHDVVFLSCFEESPDEVSRRWLSKADSKFHKRI